MTHVELMPVSGVPRLSWWGYDRAAFAVAGTYGGPDGLKRFVDACHRRGLVFCWMWFVLWAVGTIRAGLGF